MRILVSIQSAVQAWQIPPDQIQRMRDTCPQHEFLHATAPDARAEGLGRCDVAYVWSLTADELASAPHLRWVHSSAVAVGTLCLDALSARGVQVSNTRGVQGAPIAQHVCATLLALAHHLPLAWDRQRSRVWAQNEFQEARLPVLLRGQRLGVVGLGSIGEAVARLGVALGMQVVGLRRHPERGAPDGVHAVWGPDRLDALVETSDVLVLAAPWTAETSAMLDAGRLARMKRGARLVNVARGQLVDETALVEALTSGALAGAALDVFEREPLPPDSPLWDAPNLILTPHTSGFRAGHWDEVVDVFLDNLARWERGEPLRWRVDPVRGY